MNEEHIKLIHRLSITLFVVLIIEFVVALNLYVDVAIKHDNVIEREEVNFVGMIESVNLRDKLLWSAHSGSEQKRYILEFGEELKEILRMADSQHITPVNYKDSALAVDFIDYSMENSTIRLVKYCVYNSKNQNKIIANQYFLQYIGEETYFSETRYLHANLFPSEQEQFYAFEIGEECYFFCISSGSYGETYNSVNKFMNPSATVLMTDKDKFRVIENIKIPLSIPEGKHLILSQEEYIIKGKINMPEAQECIFNPDELVFEVPKVHLESEKTDVDIPALLLGLSDSAGNLRTLFIRKEDNNICADEYRGEIILPNKNQLYSVKYYVKNEDTYEDGYQDKKNKYIVGSINVKKLMYAPLNVDLTDEFNDIFTEENYMYFYTVSDIPLYIGNEYICYLQYTYESGGGSFSASGSNARFHLLTNLSNFTYTDWLLPDFKETQLEELLYGSNTRYLYREDISTYGGNGKPIIDFEQLAIKRNLGKWSVMLPIEDEYFHPGNGSYYKSIINFAVYDNNIPAYLDTKEENMNLKGWDNWSAKDLFRFPESDIELVQYDYSIEIKEYNSDYNEYLLSIPIDLDECIVSINFAESDMQEVWTKELREAG